MTNLSKTHLATIHETLAQVRRERGISQLAVAEALSLDQTTISLYENGERIIGAIGPELKPATFKRSAAKPGVLFRVELAPDDLTDEEAAKHREIVGSSLDLDALRKTE